MHPPIVQWSGGVVPLFAFIGFLLYGSFHCKWLLDNHGEKYAMLFLVVLLVTVIVGSLAIWLLIHFPLQQV